MKKIAAMLLSLILLLGCAAGTAEGAVEKIVFGTLHANGEFTLKGVLPEGYRIYPFEQDDSALISFIRAEDPARPEMILSIACDEIYSDVARLNDLSDEELAVLEKTFTDTDPYANITYDETAHGTRLLICRTVAEAYDYMDILSIYQGYMIELIMQPGKGAAEQALTEEQTAACINLLSELEFISGIEDEELKLAGNTFDAEITGFDAAGRTLDVKLLKPFLLTEWEVVSLSEGGTIRIGTEEVQIDKLTYEGDDAVINDVYRLERREDGLYTARDYEMPVLTEAAAMTLSVPEGLEFIEGIEPEYGEMLDEPVTLTADDLFAALEAAENGGIGFNTQNVTVTFGEDGTLAQVRREYTPWQ